jgi:hypothetical protein
MSKDEHRVFFSSRHCTQSQEQVTLNLPYSLNLQGKWKCAIKDIFIDTHDLSVNRFVFITSNICETSVIQGKDLPVLRKLFIEKSPHYYSFLDPIYITVSQTEINHIRLTLLDSNLKKIIFKENCLLECMFHFFKND